MKKRDMIVLSLAVTMAMCMIVCSSANTYGVAAYAWTIETVDEPGDVGEYVSIAVDSAGGVHMSYYDTTNADLKYAYRNPSTGAWTKETVDSAGLTGKYNSIAVTGSGSGMQIYISYYYETDHDLRVASKTPASTWDIRTVDSDDDVGMLTRCVISNASSPAKVHVIYFKYTTADLKHAYKEATVDVWTVETVESGNVAQESFGLGVDMSGNLHVCYSMGMFKELMYRASKSVGSWTTAETVDASAKITDSSLVAYPDGSVYLSYRDSDAESLKFAYKLSGALSWSGEVVVPGTPLTGVTHGTSIAIESFYGGKVFITYYDTAYHSLMLAYKSTGMGGAWATEEVDKSPNDTGHQSSIAIGSSGDLHIAYNDITNGNAMYATTKSGVPEVFSPILFIGAVAAFSIMVAVAVSRNLSKNNDGDN